MMPRELVVAFGVTRNAVDDGSHMEDEVEPASLCSRSNDHQRLVPRSGENGLILYNDQRSSRINNDSGWHWYSRSCSCI